MDLLVVGLGNPGTEFEGTRHNMGAAVVTALAGRHSARLRPEKGLHSLAGEARIGGHRLLLAVPLTYMNESGRAVALLVRRAGVGGIASGPAAGASGTGTVSRLVVVHDELDLPPGRIRVKTGGGTAGHNGIASIGDHLHTNAYIRVRVGIGKPSGRQPGAAYVLKRPGAAERAVLALAVDQAADAVEAIVTEGVDAAMNRVNAAG